MRFAAFAQNQNYWVWQKCKFLHHHHHHDSGWKAPKFNMSELHFWCSFRGHPIWPYFLHMPVYPYAHMAKYASCIWQLRNANNKCTLTTIWSLHQKETPMLVWFLNNGNLKNSQKWPKMKKEKWKWKLSVFMSKLNSAQLNFNSSSIATLPQLNLNTTSNQPQP